MVMAVWTDYEQEQQPDRKEQHDPEHGQTEGEPPKLQIADILRRHGLAFREEYGQRLSVHQERALRELTLCGTEALGGHVSCCAACGEESYRYNACRNRLCPRCQFEARRDWMEHRRQETLPVEYFHVIMTLPDELAELARQNAKIVYDILCRSAGNAIVHVGKKHTKLQARMGVVLILHTFGQLLNLHPHVHCVVPGGGIVEDSEHGDRWVSLPRGMFLPKAWLMEEFRQRYLKELRKHYDKRELLLTGKLAHLCCPEEFEKWVKKLETRKWILEAKSVTEQHAELHAAEDPQPLAERVVKYLSKYAGGAAMGNNRLISMENDEVTFWYKDYRDRGRRKTKSMPVFEFIWKLLMHVLPQNVPIIRHYGFLCRNQRTKMLARIRAVLGVEAPGESGQAPEQGAGDDERVKDVDQQELDKLELNRNTKDKCPHCGGRLIPSREIPRPSVQDIMEMPIRPPPKQLTLGLEYD